MNCNVTYKLAESCEKMRFSCSSFDVHNKEEQKWGYWGCGNGDRMEIEYYNDTYGGSGWKDNKR